MGYGTLYLLGDAAHLISPMSAQGVSLALHDADVFARAVVHQVENHDSSLLDSYSDTCLDHTWRQQASAVRMTEALHDSGDPSYEGEFRKRIARKNLESLLESEWDSEPDSVPVPVPEPELGPLAANYRSK
ncbi:FAD-dependent monooxygenase [Streptomyces lydicus]|uniref:FAD-dependent monooxygenase n=1 Tax=Streptomyces lydicus TaxID=47763 RepID=UPI003678F22A